MTIDQAMEYLDRRAAEPDAATKLWDAEPVLAFLAELAQLRELPVNWE